MPTPTRPSDYTLTDSDAVRLRSGGWRRFVAILGTSRDALSRPLAVGLTTLGLAGLLVSAAPSFMMGSASSGAAPTTHRCTGRGRGGGERRRVEVAWRGGDPCGLGRGCGSRIGRPGPRRHRRVAAVSRRHRRRHGRDRRSVPRSHRTPRRTRTAPSKAQAGSTGGNSGEPDGTSDLLAVQEIGGVSPLPVLSVAFLIAGLALFALRWTARRFGG